jgi:tRNA(Ile)-lysidine synthase
MEDKIYQFIIDENMLEAGDNCIVGVSGGADSVCLLTVLHRLSHRLGIRLYAVHINHMIRGEEADGDENYVKELCSRYDIPFYSYHIDVTALAAESGLTVEEAGRMARYNCFRKTGEKLDLAAYKIAVAHNKNDVCETVILNLTRGTGMSGMKGIAAGRDNIIRPLISVSRQDIEKYLEQEGIAYRTDSTNLSTDYTRNKIRHLILPELIKLNDRAVEHINQFADIAQEYYNYVDGAVKRFIEENVTTDRNMAGAEAVSVNMDTLRNEQKLICTMVIMELIGKACGGRKDIGGAHADEVKKLFDSDSGAEIMLPHGARAINNYGRLQFISANGSNKNKNGKNSDNIIENEKSGKLTENLSGYNIDIENAGIYNIPGTGHKLKVDIFDKPVHIDLTKKECTKLIDYDRIQNGISIRNFMENDYIVINSEGSRKKINRLFSDAKIPKTDRPYIPLIASGSEIIWAVGIRIGENYKINDDTKKVIRFELI